MTVCERLWTGRRLDNKMLSEPALVTDEAAHFAHDARRGSRLLLNALFRTNGYYIPEPPKPPAPVFKPVPIKIARPRGPVKKPFVPSPAVARIVVLAAKHYRVTTEEILGYGRARDISSARHVAMYLARKIEGVSFPNVGKQFNRDHTTVISGVRGVERLIAANDASTIKALRVLKRRIEA